MKSKFKFIVGLLFLVFLVAIPHFINAQKRYLIKTYTVNDGLPHNTIFSINQDNSGYLWIATDGGVSRFDGNQFDNTVIPEINYSQAFCEYIDRNPSGKLAIATFMEGVMVEQENGVYKPFFRKRKQLGKNVIRTLKWLSDSTILFSESRNINLLEGDSIKQIFDFGQNRNLFQTLEFDADRNIWFGGINGLGVFFAHADSVQPYFLPEFQDSYIIKLLLVETNKLLVGTKSGYFIIKFQSVGKDNMKYTVKKPFPELEGNYINHIYRDRQQNTWVSTAHNGVYQIKKDKIVRNIRLENGLPEDGAMCFFQDNEDNYWIGTSEGICRLSTFSDYAFFYQQQAIKNIGLIAKDNSGRLWLSNSSSLFFIENELVKSIPLSATPFSNSNVLAIDFENGQGHFFTDKGMYLLPVDIKNGWKDVQQIIDFKKEKINDLKCYYFDSDGAIWLGCTDGIYTFRNNLVEKTRIISEKTLRLRPRKILKDKFGYYWMGDYTYGLYRFEPLKENGKTSLKLINEYKSLKPDSAFATAWIQDMMLDRRGNLWLSSLATGVYCLEFDTTGVNNARLYSTKNGLSSNDVTQITEGNDGSIWFATRNGADRLVTNAMGKRKIVSYNDRTGLGRYAYQILPDDNIANICFEEGFFVINSHLEKEEDNNRLRVNIFNVSVMGKSDPQALSSKVKSYKLPYNRNFIAFDFSSIRLKQNEGIGYQYKLEGLDEEWSPLSGRRYASYNSLTPGKYTFMVRASLPNSDVPQEPTRFTFKINKPFYGTWWFIALVFLFLAALLYSIYHFRIQQLIKMRKLRTKIASDLHDDVGSTLSSISIMSDLLQSQLDNIPHAEEMIKSIGTNAHDMLESMDDIIWSVNPANDKFQNLALRIHEYAIPLFESKDIKFRIETPAEINSLPLSMEIRRGLFLIAKEAVNNLIKYSDCHKAEVIFSYENGLLKLEITDNGKGFDINNKKNGRNGLKNMKQRATQMDANFDISSGPGKGTKILLTVKTI
ncbi:MAG: hypothetical protein CSA36_05425 [Draconibacterium sp.]|nr:MAG: hypothetical protein CSA36_05425 [Draconibacterium sp.]